MPAHHRHRHTQTANSSKRKQNQICLSQTSTQSTRATSKQRLTDDSQPLKALQPPSWLTSWSQRGHSSFPRYQNHRVRRKSSTVWLRYKKEKRMSVRHFYGEVWYLQIVPVPYHTGVEGYIKCKSLDVNFNASQRINHTNSCPSTPNIHQDMITHHDTELN